jgi:hypothetical protein
MNTPKSFKPATMMLTKKIHYNTTKLRGMQRGSPIIVECWHFNGGVGA